MIYLGYDPMRGVTLAKYQDVIIVCDDDNPRAKEIVNGLYDIAQDLSELEPERKLIDGVEAVLIVKTPWMKTVPYSDQAWSDLLSIQRKKNEIQLPQ